MLSVAASEISPLGNKIPARPVENALSMEHQIHFSARTCSNSGTALS